MANEELLIESALGIWKLNVARVNRVFHPLDEADLQLEVSPGRNRLIYIWGHLAAVSDAMLPLLGIGTRLYPDLDTMFLQNPDRSVPRIYSGAELRPAWDKINQSLWTTFSEWTAGQWLEKHNSVSVEDFQHDRTRNRFSVLVNRTAHIGFHLGQAVLAVLRR